MAARGQGTVLLIEDAAPIRELLATLLRRAGYDVVAAPDGPEGLYVFGTRHPDLVLLDVHLPGMSGWDVLAQLRDRSQVPILMLTALSDDSSKVRALNGGADDYLVKPASAPELIARVGALLRRSRRIPGVDGVHTYDDGVVRVDFEARVAQVHGHEISLTPLEYRLLAAFVRRPGQILSREDLLREVWRDETGGPSDHVKIYVGYLRRKLALASDEEMVETVRGFGYRWLRHPVEREPVAASSRSWRIN
jgi:DNA-binding response OmpR family regulator